jgi:hypothetical protein
MKIKKTVTPKVIAANRTNAQKSTGPRDTITVSQNATKHGLLAKNLRFETDDEKEEFNRLVRELEEEQEPVGRMERALTEEAAVCLWKLQSANDYEAQELANRRKASKAILKILAENDDKEQLPLFATQWDGSPSPAQLGWECEELVVRADTKNSELKSHESGDKKGKAGHVQIEAKLNTSLDAILRYQAAIKRDFYRAFHALRRIRRERSGKD